jgi:hypothetical protein
VAANAAAIAARRAGDHADATSASAPWQTRPSAAGGDRRAATASATATTAVEIAPATSSLVRSGVGVSAATAAGMSGKRRAGSGSRPRRHTRSSQAGMRRQRVAPAGRAPSIASTSEAKNAY